MERRIEPGSRKGSVSVPSSKSQAHRILIASALSGSSRKIRCRGLSDDIRATMACLESLGAAYEVQDDQIQAQPLSFVKNGANRVVLPCRESGSTLRFLLPLAGALHVPADLLMEGRLPQRPMKEYEAVLKSHGMQIQRNGSVLQCEGQLIPGDYLLPGNISSQYFTGLMMALPLLDGDSTLTWQGILESADYVAMTADVLQTFGIVLNETGNGFRIPGNQHYRSAAGPKDCIPVEGDYSSAAFFLCMGAFSETGITVHNLSPASRQGDRRILEILQRFGAEVNEKEEQVTVCKGSLQGIDLDASMIPDLVPVLSVVACAAKGSTRIHHAQRLRLKESDRIQSTCRMLECLGARVKELVDGLLIEGTGILPGGSRVDPYKDHRIAMAAAVAAGICHKPVTILDTECAGKSYPEFWKDLEAMERE